MQDSLFRKIAFIMVNYWSLTHWLYYSEAETPSLLSTQTKNVPVFFDKYDLNLQALQFNLSVYTVYAYNVITVHKNN